MPNTKIVATLGPASDVPGLLSRLFEAGVDVFRLNASHGTQEQHAARIRAVRQLALEHGKHAGILLDLQGPKIRLQKFENGSCELVAGSEFTITVEPILGNDKRASTGYARFAKDVKAGDRVLIADGSDELRALETDGSSVRCEVIRGGEIGDNKGINLPVCQVSAPSLTEKDLSDLTFGLDAGVDMVALSFVRTPEDVRQLRQRLDGRKSRLPIIAKIEKPQAWENIDSILEVSDGVMVARGDLGVEMALERVPLIQKSIIARARRSSKFVITATQMLESMIQNSVPTRAEVSDVANAIFDGSDALMVSAETSIGNHPVEAVQFMARIANETERSRRTRAVEEFEWRANPTYAEIVANAACYAAREANVSAIVVFTTTEIERPANLPPPPPAGSYIRNHSQ